MVFMETPFKSIGLTLSGGGYKAAAFHLGTLSYLRNLGLDTNIHALSTVSGGTITGIAYVMSLLSDEDFEVFFEMHKKFLINVNMLEESLEYLSGGDLKVPSGRKNLIVAASRAYSEKLLKKEDGRYFFSEILDSDIPLSEIIINTTELTHGLDFRFQKSRKNLPSGNKEIRIAANEIKNASIADMVAASTCYPGALEPIGFPFDFTWKNGEIPKKVYDKFAEGGEKSSMGLIDGGVYDNQGIESIMIADERLDFNLSHIIVSDVSSYSDNSFRFNDGKKVSSLTLGSFDIMLRAVIILCLFTSVTMVFHLIKGLFDGSFDPVSSIFSYIIPLILSLSSASIVFWLRRKAKSVISEIPLIGNSLWEDLKKFTIDQMVNGILVRVSSLFNVATEVLTKRVRSLVYLVFYTDKRYDNKRVSNLLETLVKGRKLPTLPPEVKKPSTQIIDIATKASRVEAAAWLEERSDLKNLISTGQFTTCYNLIKFIVRIHGDDPEKYDADLKKQWDKLISDWDMFVENPFFLYENIDKR